MKFLNCHKNRALLQKLAMTKNEVISCCSVQHANNKEWTLNMKKGGSFNASNKCSNDHIHRTKNK